MRRSSTTTTGVDESADQAEEIVVNATAVTPPFGNPEELASNYDRARKELEDYRSQFKAGSFVQVNNPRFNGIGKVQATREFGWVSKSTAWETGRTATASIVESLMAEGKDASESDRVRAEEIIAFFADPQTEPENEFDRNVRVICRAGYCSDKSFGLACALDVCHKVALKKADSKERKQRQRDTSRHLWEPKQRVKGIEAEVLMVFHHDTDWGVSVTTILEDSAGNVLKAKDLGAEVGNRVRFTATVKDHTEFDGVKQTSLLRAKDIVILGATSVNRH